MQQTTKTVSVDNGPGVPPGVPGMAGVYLACGDQLCHEWKWMALRGVLSIAFGVLAMVWPLATIWTLALFWGAFAFLDGVSAGMTGWRLYKRGVRWWPYLAFAAIGIVAGVAAFV
mgnify:CR=1 FL=1